VKKRNMPPETWEKLRVDERIETEKEFIPKLDHVAATSSLIRDSLRDDYGRSASLFLPPCVKPEKFYAREIPEDHEIWDFLSTTLGRDKDEMRRSRYITEVSRTDKTKRKDVLIRAYAKAREEHPELKLIVSIDSNEEELYAELTDLIRSLGVEDGVVVIGHEAERMPSIYSITAVYCSPSVMEGFGMSVQEAAATSVPVVGSDKIPFVKEYLLGEKVREEKAGDGDTAIQIGEGGIVVPADQTDGFAYALDLLLSNEDFRRRMGERALDITVPYFTWEEMTRRLLNKMGVEP
jgi:glycosyltransferase involved in cell wall biosynthesis